MPAPLISRTEEEKTFGPIYIAGVCVVGAILLGLLAWITVRILRRRAQKKRDDVRGASFLSVKGIVKDENMQAIPGGTFSRDQLTRSIILPEKPDMVLNRNNPQDILDYHRESGMFPKPFAPIPILRNDGDVPLKPFSFALGAGGNIAKPDRSSFLSVGSRFSVLSSLSTTSSNESSAASTRKVRQLFNPILPDELTVNVNERLTVVQSFDDGWCVVGRENKTGFGGPQSLFKAPSAQQETVELGVVPAWCFIKPTKGLKAERPVRSTSLGITVQIDAPGFSSRDDLISWSNF